MGFWQRLLYGSEIVIGHKFHKPPWGGGNQFLLALRDEWEKQGIDVGANSFGRNTKGILLNSHTFTPSTEKKVIASGAMVVHRIDGPTSVYGRKDTTLDKKIYDWNLKHATRTVFQSQYSLNMHQQLGMEFVKPTVIHNAVNPSYFYPAPRAPLAGRKIRLMAGAWSNNPKKGKSVYEWLDTNLDFSRFEFSFVGRVDAEFKNIRLIPPVGSAEMGNYLRQADIYIFASQFDSCSNALLEALSSGMPAIYHKSGGSPELVREGGVGFDNQEEIPAALDKIAADLEGYRSRIKVRSLPDVAADYLRVFRESRT